MNTSGDGMDEVALGIKASTGQRIAGAVLIVNAVLVVFEAFIMPEPVDRAGGFSPGVGVTSIIDLALGVSLVAGHTGAIKFSLLRVALGIVFFTLLKLLEGDWLAAGMQVAVSSALLLLLVGRAGKPRIVGACVVFGLYVALEALGVYVILSGHNPIGHAVLSARGDLVDGPAGDVTGELLAYRLRAPSDAWYLRNSDVARRDNPLADRWLIRPDVDAHILVIAEAVPTGILPLELFTDAVVANTRGAASKFEMLARSELPGHPGSGRWLHFRATVKGIDVEYFAALRLAYGFAFQVLAFAPTSSFPALAGELKSALESFTLPADVELRPAARVAGRAAAYALTPANERWLVVPPDQLARHPAGFDAWLTRLDVDAQLTVVIEDLADDLTQDALAAEMPAHLLARWPAAQPETVAPLDGPHARGHILHAELESESGPLAIDYAAHVVGRRAFHLFGLLPRAASIALGPELRQILASFEPPPGA